MAARKRQPSIRVFTSDKPGITTVGVFHHDPETDTVAATFYHEHSPGVLEQRVWCPQWEPDDSELQDLVDEFQIEPKHPVTAEGLKRIPWQAMSRYADAHFANMHNDTSTGFRPPTFDEIETLIEEGDFVGYRTSRDLRGHAQQLRAVQTYLQAVTQIDDSSVSPITAIAESEGITIPSARSLLERARANGYISRPTDSRGAQVQQAAIDEADRIREAFDNLDGGDN